ncbi:MAG: FimB/Mfa2 family fimbrial subunit [Tannerella sp.]|jgi:hypothetical protein|nr:FimB/Mfa2 family fimbrial subunit [Tannerella sp.]
MKRMKYFLFALALSGAFSSCINEDLSNCAAGDTRVYFNYTLPKAGSYGIVPDSVKQLQLFVFDMGGNLVTEQTDTAPKLSPDYYMEVKALLPGQYKFVAWGNVAGRQYSFTGLTKSSSGQLDQMTVDLQDIGDGSCNDQLHPLFYATHADAAETIVADKSQRIQLQMVEDTYKINVTVMGMDSLSAADNAYQAEISDNNGNYKFDNSIAPCAEFNYIQPMAAKPATHLYRLDASLSVLQLAASRKHPVLSIRNESTKALLFQDNLVELILAANEVGAAINFTNTHDFNIIYMMNESSSMSVVLYINGWKVVRQNVIM